MKKFLYIIVGMLIFVLISTVCYAGSVPEDLVFEDSTQVYFGKVKNVDGDSITVIQQKNIKGEFTQDSELTYKSFAFNSSPKIGATYLCGYYDKNNPLYMWDVTSLDTKTLKIKSTDDMSRRMQEYLNNGKFEEKEKEKLTKTDTKDDTESTSESTTATIADNTNQTHNDSSTGTNYLIILILCGAVLIGIVILVRTKRKKDIG